MSTLVVELPDNQMSILERVAHERGLSIDALIIELVNTITIIEDVDPAYDVTQDALYTLHAHDSSAPADLAGNADTYLYGSHI